MITEPSARKISENSEELVPICAPSASSGVKPVPALIVPVVARLLVPNDIDPFPSRILPLWIVIVPNSALVLAFKFVKFPSAGEAAPIVVPSITPPSILILLMF